MDRGTWWAITHGVIESDMTEYTHTHAHKMPELVTDCARVKQ